MRNSSKGNSNNKIPPPTGSDKKITIINRTNSGMKSKIPSSNQPKSK